MVVVGDLPLYISFPKRFGGRNEDHLYKGNELAEDEPDVDVFDIGCLGQGLHHGDEDRCQDQHIGQVYGQSGLKIFSFEECGGESDANEKEGWEIGPKQLTHHPPLQHHDELDTGLVPHQHPLLDDVHGQLQLLLHDNVLWKETDCFDVKFACDDPYAANLANK